MILTKGNRSTGRQISPSATLSTTNPILPGLGSKMCLQDDSSDIKLLRYRTATTRSKVRLNTVMRRMVVP
jgi:hypothetical protein